MRRKKDIIAAWLFLAPAIIVFLALVAYPILFSGYASLTKWKFTDGVNGMKWTGFQNYQNLVKDINFKAAVQNTFIYTLVSVPISILLALIFSYLLNNKVLGAKVLRTFYFIPYVANAVAIAALFFSWFRADGMINSLLGLFGVPAAKWLTDSVLCKIPVIFMLIWTILGYLIIIYMGALQNVPADLYEAAEIDGASKLQQFGHITVPLVSQTTFYLLVVRMIDVFKVFTSVNILSMGSALKANSSIVLEVYNTAFGRTYNFGKACAESWVLVFIILIFTAVQFVGEKKWVHY